MKSRNFAHEEVRTECANSHINSHFSFDDVPIKGKDAKGITILPKTWQPWLQPLLQLWLRPWLRPWLRQCDCSCDCGYDRYSNDRDIECVSRPKSLPQSLPQSWPQSRCSHGCSHEKLSAQRNSDILVMWVKLIAPSAISIKHNIPMFWGLLCTKSCSVLFAENIFLGVFTSSCRHEV